MPKNCCHGGEVAKDFRCDWRMENSPQKVINVNESTGLAKHHQTFSFYVRSGGETRKCNDLDYVELSHLIIWKLYQGVEHVIEYAKGSHTDNSTFPN